MTERNFEKEKKLLKDWQYFRPYGPYTGDGSTMKNLDAMADEDVERLIEVADEMAEYIDGL